MTSVDTREPPFTRSMFERALQVARCSDVPSERVQAARVAVMIAHADVATDERLLSDVMMALAARLADAGVVDLLVSALRRLTNGDAALARGLERLAARAYAEHLRDSLCALATHILACPAWASGVRREWASTILRFDCHQSVLVSRRLILRYVDDHGYATPWMREAVELHAEHIFKGLSDVMRWRLHQVAPTVHGWRILAAAPDQSERPLSPGVFGDQLDVAVETLQAALTSEPGGARRVVLASWLIEVAE